MPDDSTTSLVLPDEEGLNGAGPDEPPVRSQGLGGGLLATISEKTIQYVSTYQ